MYTGDNAEYWPEIDIFTTPRMSHFEFFAEYYNLNPPVFVCPGAPLRTSKNREELKSFYWESFTDAPKLDAFYKAESDITKRLCSYGTSEWILMKHATTEDKGGSTDRSRIPALSAPAASESSATRVSTTSPHGNAVRRNSFMTGIMLPETGESPTADRATATAPATFCSRTVMSRTAKRFTRSTTRGENSSASARTAATFKTGESA